MVHVLIMAGGKGSRFWPLSRQKKAKQFLSIVGEKTLIEYTINRIVPLCDKEQRWILGNHSQAEHLSSLEQLVPPSNILAEPLGKNTAACIAWAAMEIEKKDPTATCVVVPADAWIEDSTAFLADITTAIKIATTTQQVVTLGIKPTTPHTGYGYIDVVDQEGQIGRVRSFKEKPTDVQAQSYLEAETYYWNAGIFVWQIQTLLPLLQTYLPDHYRLIRAFTTQGLRSPAAVQPFYDQLDAISIDYGIMEHIADQMAVVLATFSWDDIGSWAALESYLPQDEQANAHKGTVVAHNSTGNIIVADKKVVALAHVHNLIIVDTPDALLILPKDKDQEIKALYEQLPPHCL